MLGSGATPALVTLDLSGNKIGDRGLSALAAALAAGHSTAIEAIDLRTNKIGDAGFEALAEAIRTGALPALRNLFSGDCNLHRSPTHLPPSHIFSHASSHLLAPSHTLSHPLTPFHTLIFTGGNAGSDAPVRKALRRRQQQHTGRPLSANRRNAESPPPSTRAASERVQARKPIGGPGAKGEGSGSGRSGRAVGMGTHNPKAVGGPGLVGSPRSSPRTSPRGVGGKAGTSAAAKRDTSSARPLALGGQPQPQAQVAQVAQVGQAQVAPSAKATKDKKGLYLPLAAMASKQGAHGGALSAGDRWRDAVARVGEVGEVYRF